MNIFELAKRNQQKAWEIIEDTRIVRIWEGMGAKSACTFTRSVSGTNVCVSWV